MGYLSTHEEIRAVRLDREQVADLISRYPQLSESENRQILSFLRNGRHLDIGLLTSNDRLRPKLEAFIADHQAHFRLKWREGAGIIGVILAAVVAMGFAWEALA